jgi:voltage-gated potassium channel Kch
VKGIRFVRLIRVIRLFRVAWRVRRLRGRLRRVLRVSGLVAAISTSGALALRMLEPETVGSFSEAMWWSIVTMSTVGYGDISPATPAGRGVAMSMIIVGIAIFGYAVSVLTSVIVEPAEEESEELKAILLRMESRLEQLEAAQRPSNVRKT